MSDWQNITALVCVALAAAYVVWRAVRMLARRAGSRCGGCPSCGEADAQQPPHLVSLQPPPTKPRE